MRTFSLPPRPRKKPNPEGWDGYDWNEAQPKWPATRIMNTVFAVVSAVVWVLILFRIFSTSAGKFDHMILLNQKAEAYYPETRQVLRIHSQAGEDAKGEVIVDFPVYLEKAQNLQLTARVNRRTLPPGKEGGYTFVIRESGDGDSRYYPLSYSKSEKRPWYWYTFYRLCFEGVELDPTRVYTLLVFRDEPEGDFSASRADFRFTLLNSETYCNTVTVKESDFYRYE